MKTVAEVSKLTGVSVRTLHHYDAIGLLKAARVTQSGYRLYDEGALRRLQTILLFRELKFPLKQIKTILDSPNFDPRDALEAQIQLLRLQRDRLDELIRHAQNLREKGVSCMNFKPFDNAKLESYAAEAKEKWGATAAYKEFAEKTKGQTVQKQQQDGEYLMDIFREFGNLRHLPPESDAVQAKVAQLQSFITAHYYTCTPQILRGLGQMYIAGDSMTENIDNAGGAGTAEFVHKAIEVCCK